MSNSDFDYLYNISYLIVVVIICLVVGVILIFLLRIYFRPGWCRSNAILKGKTVIVTGGNAGIGKIAAHDFARRGARVILACRNLDKATLAKREIERDSFGEVVVQKLDLSSFKSIRKFAENILSTEPKIDILVNNAGLTCNKATTEDGFDLLFQTNHLGPFLLTNLLLDKLKESAPSRIVNVSSALHWIGKMYWDDLNHDKPNSYDPFPAYNDSKLANILFTKELAKKLKGTGVTTYALHPGRVKTEFAENVQISSFVRFVTSFFDLIAAKTPIEGAQTTIYCVVSEEIENESGFYYSDCKKARSSSRANNANDAKKLWEISAKMVGLDSKMIETEHL